MGSGDNRQPSGTTLEITVEPSHLDLMPIPLALWDGARSHCVINPAAAKLTGFSQDQLQTNPQHWIQQIHGADFILFRDFLKRAAATQYESACDYRFLCNNDNEAIWLRETIIPLQASSGPWQTLSSYIDITDLKTAAARADPIPAEQLEDKVIRTMFHEIRNCLQRLSMEIELAALESRLQADVSRRFTDALQAVNQSLTEMRAYLLSPKPGLPADE